MQVLLKEGIRAGQVVEMPWHIAQPLIEAGRVVDLRSEQQPEEKPVVSTPTYNRTDRVPNQRRRR